METSSKIKTIAFLGDYLPRKCGIATFTSDLVKSVATNQPEIECFVLAVNDIEAGCKYSDIVHFEIDEQDLTSYQRAAHFINISNVDMVCVQHEFGIFGGPAGNYVLALLRELKTPVVTTLHTVLRAPNCDQRCVMQELIARSTRLVVMTRRAKQMLQEVYQAPPPKIDLIPHGIPDSPIADPNDSKVQFGLEGKTVLLTFGLLSPNKGIENVLHALPAILAEFPDVVYIVLGVTHPNELREQGEAYRHSLEILAQKNHVDKNVIFYNRFVELEELKEFLGAADIYVTPYLNEAQITSGTLAYAFGAGKAVVSTPYWHAAELLAEDRGVLVPFGDSKAISSAVMRLLYDPPRLNGIRKRAYKLGREMVWSNTARLYMRSFESARLDRAVLSPRLIARKTHVRQPRALPKLEHLSRITDSRGIFQHAIFTTSNLSEGYCTDGGARAFILTVQLEELEEQAERVRLLATTDAALLDHPFGHKTKRAHNHLSFERHGLDDSGSDGPRGRALWALGVGVGCSPYRSLQIMAAQPFAETLPGAMEVASPRAWAFSLIGIHEYLRRLDGDSAVNQIRDAVMATLIELFCKTVRPGWRWFEESSTYDDAKLAHAVILSGQATGEQSVLERDMKSLRWPAEVQSSENGGLRPVGRRGFGGRGDPRGNHEHQLIEPQAMVSTCLDAYLTTSDAWTYVQAQRAFDWSIGWNNLGLELYSPSSGGSVTRCR